MKWITILLLASAAFAQVKTTTKDGVITFTNTSKKTIILVTGDLQLDGKKTGPFAHEFLFKKLGWPAGDAFDLDTKNDGEIKNYSIVVKFIQFEDGTIWGDPTTESAKDALEKRTGTLAFLPSLATVSDEAEFMTVLTSKQVPGSAAEAAERRFQSIQAQVGTATALANARDRYAAAIARHNLWSF